MSLHIHIVGIAGTFMGSIARLAQSLNYKVTGCDTKIYPPMSTQLEELGIKVIEGFEEDQLKLNPDIYIIGNVAKRGMPIIEAILNKQLPYISGPQWLFENLLNKCQVLAISGTHGKTTTSAMLTWILEYAGYKPGFLIGGVVENFGISSRLPDFQSEHLPFFVIEADEYDTAFFDKRSKFVHYHPSTLIINNLEYDHADIFQNLDAIKNQFHHLIRMMPNQGKIIYHYDENIKDLLHLGCWSKTEPFNHPSGYDEKSNIDGSQFDVFYQNKLIGNIQWQLMGKHNRLNAIASIAAAKNIGISYETSCRALNLFKNVKRRMEIKGVINNITVYDDFAHHPSAIKTTIQGLRKKIGNDNRIISVLEPRSNTMKLGSMKSLLCSSLENSDLVFCYTKSIDWNIEESLTPIQSKTKIFRKIDDMINEIIHISKENDHILIMSNGDFKGIHHKIIDGLKNK